MVLSLDRWVGKVAVVTGASAGIGASIAEQLVKNGIVVAGLARRKERIDELVKKLANEKGKLIAVKCDVTKEDEIITAFENILKNVGPIHILINNAGLNKFASLIEGDTQAWKTVLDTNVLGLSIATREAIKQMKNHKIDGHVIHINSIAGHRAINFEGAGVYPATKFAVTALTETLRHEINHQKLKIKITSVSPGYVETEFIEVWLQEKAKDIGQLIGLKPDDVTDAVVYALSTPPHVNVSEITVRMVGEAE